MNFKTVIGDSPIDKKGDITALDYVVYRLEEDATARSLTSNVRRPVGIQNSAAEYRKPRVGSNTMLECART